MRCEFSSEWRNPDLAQYVEAFFQVSLTPFMVQNSCMLKTQNIGKKS